MIYCFLFIEATNKSNISIKIKAQLLIIIKKRKNIKYSFDLQSDNIETEAYELWNDWKQSLLSNDSQTVSYHFFFV